MDSELVNDPSAENLDNTQISLTDPDVIARINRNTVHRICSGQASFCLFYISSNSYVFIKFRLY